jgi:hypothetical protein
MGIGFSRSDRLYTNITDTIKRLIIDYELWTDEKSCAKYEVIYFNKLLKFRKNDLLDVASAIGYKYQQSPTNPLKKEAICKDIICHFKRRIVLLSEILNVLDKVRTRVKSAVNGPVCRGVNKYIDNFITCNSVPNSLWLVEEEYQNMIKNLKKTDKYNEWKKWVDKLDDKYFEYLQKIFRLIKTIKNDIDSTLNDIEFTKLELYGRELTKKIDIISEVYYLLIINF